LARDSVEGYFHSVSIFPDSLRRRLFSRRFERELQGHRAIDVFKRHAARAPAEEPLSLVQYLDYKTYLPGDILTKVDRASMAHGLEVRVPILDHELVDWASGVAPTQKLNGREGKYFFKKALETRLPSDVLYRPKMGFAVPLASWFRNELKQRSRDLLAGEHLHSDGMFDNAFIARMLDRHQAGASDFSAPLWALLMFEASKRRVLSL
jgi:asparagine synthase (glutamine-hydrolysing)